MRKLPSENGPKVRAVDDICVASQPLSYIIFRFFRNHFALHLPAFFAILPTLNFGGGRMRTLTTLVFFIGCPALASAQLRFVQPSVELGELRGGPSYAHRFEFVNEAAGPIEITDFRLGCGCLQPVLDKRVYQAGEKGTLVMNLRTLGQQEGPRA